MKPNLGGEGFIRKPKLKKLSRTSLRLCGWIRFRLKRANTCFVHIRLPEFCKMTGVSDRTARRAINALRVQDNEFIFRTINRKGKWQILVSDTATLAKHEKSEPCLMDENGNKQLVKTSLKGETITQEQLLLSENPVFWNAKADDKSTDDEVELHEETHENPNQMMVHWNTQNSKFGKTLTINSHLRHTNNSNTWTTKNRFGETDKNQASVIRGNTSVFKNTHQKESFSLKKMKLAFHLAREMRMFHYENIKIKWEMCFAYTFARESLMKNARKQTILRAWDLAVHEMHAEAVDQGVTQSESWRAGSTLATARRILADGGCYDKWKPSLVMG